MEGNWADRIKIANSGRNSIFPGRGERINLPIVARHDLDTFFGANKSTLQLTKKVITMSILFNIKNNNNKKKKNRERGGEQGKRV